MFTLKHAGFLFYRLKKADRRFLFSPRLFRFSPLLNNALFAI